MCSDVIQPRCCIESLICSFFCGPLGDNGWPTELPHPKAFTTRVADCSCCWEVNIWGCGVVSKLRAKVDRLLWLEGMALHRWQLGVWFLFACLACLQSNCPPQPGKQFPWQGEACFSTFTDYTEDNITVHCWRLSVIAGKICSFLILAFCLSKVHFTYIRTFFRLWCTSKRTGLLFAHFVSTSRHPATLDKWPDGFSTISTWRIFLVQCCGSVSLCFTC